MGEPSQPVPLEESSHPLPDTAADLYDMVTVHRVACRAPGIDSFTGHPVLGPSGRIFGGQLLGQAVSAATATTATDTGRVSHSMHAYFVRAGDAARPVVYDVERVRDGRSFSVRSVRAHQDDRLLFTTTLSFHEPGPGFSHQVESTVKYPDPDSVPLDDDSLATPRSGHRSAVELRRVPRNLDPEAAAGRSGPAVWFRAASPGSPVTEAASRAALALATDFTILEAVVDRHGLTFSTPGLTVVSLDHALWWHAPANLDDWVLYVQESPWAGGERGLVSGRLYDRGGRLVASVAQEGLFRLDNDAPSGSPS
jgi:acyl-CoA thioesterase-2